MSEFDYREAQKLAVKEYKKATAWGESPYPIGLETIVSSGQMSAGRNLGLEQIPLALVVGTKHEGRNNAFARNFMPLLSHSSEFAAKWKILCAAHLEEGIRECFAGDAKAFVCEYFRQQREMLKFDFDILGHPDLVRKFNVRHPYFDETASWYVSQLEESALAIAASGKIVEVNTGAISRGWLDDAYPSPVFRKMLRERGVRFVLSSDSHAADTVDCGFGRFAEAEKYIGKTVFPPRGGS